jgi:formylglycine-generating enzyme required for sulfatase activity
MIDKIVLVLLFLLCNAGMAYALELPFRQLSSAETSGLAGKSISGKMVQNDSLKAVVKRDSALASKEKEGKDSEEKGVYRTAMLAFFGGLLGILSTWGIIAFQRRKRIPDITSSTTEVLKAQNEHSKRQKEDEARKKEEWYRLALITDRDKCGIPSSSAFTSFMVKLSQTFVSLSLSFSSQGQKSEISPGVAGRHFRPEEVIKQAFERHRLLLVLGDPGSGKTTLLSHYVLKLLQNECYGAFGFMEPLKVFFFSLRDLKKEGGNYPTLALNLSAWTQGRLSGELFSQWLEDEESLVLLDGLDEISDVQDRIDACKWIDRIVTHTQALVVVSSRTTGYRKGDGIELLSLHSKAEIENFTPEMQDEFIGRWFSASYSGEVRPPSKTDEEWNHEQQDAAKAKERALVAFLTEKKHEQLRELAGIPLLLQIMATLWKERDSLPKSRAELYDVALSYLLDYRDRQRGLAPLLTATEAKKVLAPVALWMQEELKKDEADREEMQKRMQGVLKGLDNPPPVDAFFKNIVDRAGLLVAYVGNDYRFSHKTFREYLAAFQLREDRPYRQLNNLIVCFGSDQFDWWQETLRFFIWQVDAMVFDAFMQKLFDSPVSATLLQKQQDLLALLVEEAPWKKIDALKAKLLEPNIADEQKNNEALKVADNRKRYVLRCLEIIGTEEAVDAVREFVQAEPKLTDDRDILRLAYEIPGVKIASDITADIACKMNVSMQAISVRYNPYELDAQYILIEGGTFTFSMTGQQEKMPDLYVAKYTVTNKLYRQFIGYFDSKESAFSDTITVETYKKRLFAFVGNIDGFSDYLKGEQSWAKLFSSYFDDDKRFNKDEQPVVGVTWYAARAYCLWLSLLESNGQDDALYRLPTEKEWEYAAGGKESRTYPWGEEGPSTTRANYNENEGATTPVGRYSDGATPEGLYDMAGNVWEWTEDLYENSTSDEYFKSARALRGGSWDSDPESLRCSARVLNHPAYWINFIGFRVVRSSPSS